MKVSPYLGSNTNFISNGLLGRISFPGFSNFSECEIGRKCVSQTGDPNVNKYVRSSNLSQPPGMCRHNDWHYIISKYEKWGNQNIVYFISFAAGVLISVSFIHIIPKSFGMNETAPIYLLVGFMGLYVFNRFLNVFVCHDRERAILSSGSFL